MKKSILFLLLFTLLPIFGSAKVLIDGIYYNLSGSTASVTYTGDIWSVGSYSGEVEIPETVMYNGVTYTVTSIGESAFYKCQDLTGVIIPSSVKSIGRVAFDQCSNLKSLIIPNSVTSIGEAAFQICTSLKNVVISNSLRSINESLFDRCTSLTSIEIPNSVTSIGENAFYKCSGLPNIDIPNSVVSIGDFAFQYCSGFDRIDIPSSVVSIGSGAFGYCNNIKTITVAEDNPKYDSRDNCNAVIETESNTLIVGCNSSKIPNSVVAIGNEAFYGCNCFKYSSITFSESIRIIGNLAFFDTFISSMFFLGEIDRIGYQAFNSYESAGSIKYLAFYGNINNPIGTHAFWHDRRYTSERQRYINNIIIGPDVDCIEGMNVSPGGNIYSYNPVPPTADENSFLAYNSTVHVPASSLAAYFIAPYWSNFANIVGDAIEPTDVTISQDTIVLNITDAPINLSAVVTPANANPNEILWSSTKKNIATVSNGKVSAVGAGECDIIAQCLNRFDTCHVVVKDSTVTVTLDLQEAMVLPNHIITLTPSASPIMPDLSVTSTDPSVAAARVVNNKVQVVGIKEGTTTITVGSADGTAIPATCLVTVYTEPGDMNCDGFVNISDVTSLIDYLLSGDDSQISTKNADVNGDESINISDVTELIDILLSGS